MHYSAIAKPQQHTDMKKAISKKMSPSLMRSVHHTTKIKHDSLIYIFEWPNSQST